MDLSSLHKRITFSISTALYIKEYLTQAAKLSNKSLSDFMVTASLKAADEVFCRDPSGDEDDC